MNQTARDKPYYDLQATYARHPVGAPLTDTFIEILKFYFEPEEARLAAHMGFEPEPEEAIARRAGMSLDEAAPLLTRMASRYFVRGFRRPDGVRTFRLHILALGAGLFEVTFDMPNMSPDMEKLGELWNKYFRDGWGREMHGSGISVCRALPAVSVYKENVVRFEDALDLVKNAGMLTLNPCACRQAFRACDDPVEVCIGLSGAVPGGQEPGMPLMDPAKMSELVGRIASADEVVDALQRAEEAGLVHISMNHKDDPWFICNCCRHACGLLRGVTELGITHAVAPSSYWTMVDEDMCSGCENCVERCPVGAISMREDGVAEVMHEKCLGCGVCALVCGPGALTLEKRDDLIFTPYEDDRELFTLLAERKGVAYPVHHHQAVIPG
ncbi:MAG: 4Fe-4S binding protein [Chloroflexota bacterium]|nr:4Fe-4S binding protein [Chloroflexota bacterium]